MERTNDQTRNWIAATQKGDLSWFDQFYLDNNDPFIKWAKGEFSIPEEEIRDVYQQAVVVFYENLIDGKLNHLSSSIKTYLFGIGKNLLLKKVTRREIEHRHMDKLTEHWLFQGSSNLDYSKTIDKVKKELLDLKEPCQSILEMFYLKNLGLDVIAKRLNYGSSDVVKTQKSRCLKSFRTKINKWWNLQIK
jgi:RNA polymerase sigma-70 factor (ECF subfamily)